MRILRFRIIVGGRFHSDEMACALHQLGHRVTVVTTLPRSRFPRLEIHQTEPHIVPEVIFRTASMLGMGDWGDHYKMKSFGKIAARKMPALDVIIGWSSFALEAFKKAGPAFKILVRDSTHIEHQMEILKKEHAHLKLPFDERAFCVKRELDEYQRADQIVVLSELAKKTFIDKGFPADKVKVLRLGVDTSRFLPSTEYSTNRPLKVVYFGTIGVRKGIDTLLRATVNFSADDLEVHLIGPVERGFKKILGRYTHARVHAALSQGHLADYIRRMHIFCLPTIEDGFGQTVLQAMASGLPVITTTHCGAGELIKDGVNGFIVPALDVRALGERLNSLIENPETLLEMRKKGLETARDCSWMAYKAQLQAIVEPLAASKAAA